MAALSGGGRVYDVDGDLLDRNYTPCAEHWCIAQQLNTVTTHAAGLARAIAYRYPYANVYAARRDAPGRYNYAEHPSEVGTITVSEPPPSAGAAARPVIFGLMAQRGPSKPGTRNNPFPPSQDNAALRRAWFELALRRCMAWMRKTYGTERRLALSIPHLIGCGLAGGDWTRYRRIIEMVAADCGIDVYMVRLPLGSESL
jgi:hypothetical protein